MYILPSNPSSTLHPLRPTADGDNAGAGDFDQAERQHQGDELVDLLGRARDLENEALDAGIDHARPESVGETQRLYPVLALAAHLHHRKLALDRRARDR